MKTKIKFMAAAALLISLVLLCQSAGKVLRKEIQEGRAVSSETGSAVVLLDPGHGGMDAGKTGVNGAEEKEINLKIALYIKKLLEKENIDVVMTRTEDQRLAETQVEDLKERVRIMNKANPVLAVSIHQNSYHEGGVHGAQVFYYGDSAEGKEAGEIMQRLLNENIPDNRKEAKANRSYYILKKTEVPVIIVECGFLSNYEEAQKLADEKYQQTMADVIKEGILSYIQQTGEWAAEKSEPGKLRE